MEAFNEVFNCPGGTKSNSFKRDDSDSDFTDFESEFDNDGQAASSAATASADGAGAVAMTGGLAPGPQRSNVTATLLGSLHEDNYDENDSVVAELNDTAHHPQQQQQQPPVGVYGPPVPAGTSAAELERTSTHDVAVSATAATDTVKSGPASTTSNTHGHAHGHTYGQAANTSAGKLQAQPLDGLQRQHSGAAGRDDTVRNRGISMKQDDCDISQHPHTQSLTQTVLQSDSQSQTRMQNQSQRLLQANAERESDRSFQAGKGDDDANESKTRGVSKVHSNDTVSFANAAQRDSQQQQAKILHPLPIPESQKLVPQRQASSVAPSAHGDGIIFAPINNNKSTLRVISSTSRDSSKPRADKSNDIPTDSKTTENGESSAPVEQPGAGHAPALGDHNPLNDSRASETSWNTSLEKLPHANVPLTRTSSVYSSSSSAQSQSQAQSQVHVQAHAQVQAQSQAMKAQTKSKDTGRLKSS